MTEAERIVKLREVLAQYEDGAITYIEFVRWCAARVTEQDVKDHQEYCPGPKFKAVWPFEG